MMVWSFPTKWKGGDGESVVLDAAGACGWAGRGTGAGGVEM